MHRLTHGDESLPGGAQTTSAPSPAAGPQVQPAAACAGASTSGRTRTPRAHANRIKARTSLDVYVSLEGILDNRLDTAETNPLFR